MGFWWLPEAGSPVPVLCGALALVPADSTRLLGQPRPLPPHFSRSFWLPPTHVYNNQSCHGPPLPLSHDGRFLTGIRWVSNGRLIPWVFWMSAITLTCWTTSLALYPCNVPRVIRRPNRLNPCQHKLLAEALLCGEISVRNSSHANTCG